MQSSREPFQFDPVRFAELVYYICDRYDPDVLGAVRLNKALYFADMMNFASAGSPLTGERYVKHQFGPVAEHLEEAIARLKSDGRIVESTRRYDNGTSLREFATKGGSNEALFSDAERAIIDRAAELTIRHTARQISEFSHHKIWEAAEFGEELPYETIFHVFPPPVSDEAYDWARQEIRSGAYSR